ncbi:hypothetical protein DFQ28_009939 [Apophysomyces sp. BC1034]|nr:hypothetical protein DFQ30_009843 [Apophysomyces sp. BC1015]KAG0181573.1 hypothetical protein DFQ29_007934 [Apophysomyces sp. BC1021]KAG0192179.1 hypothetical protein DFQ28_009939 [Apophysomyces sp. BC1034]
MVLKKLFNKMQHRLTNDAQEPFSQRRFCRWRSGASVKKAAGSASLDLIPSSLNPAIPAFYAMAASTGAMKRFVNHRPPSCSELKEEREEEEVRAVVIPDVLDALRATDTSIDMSISTQSTMKPITFLSDTSSELSIEDKDSFLEAVLHGRETFEIPSKSEHRDLYSFDSPSRYENNNAYDLSTEYFLHASSPFGSETQDPTIAPPSPPESPGCTPSRSVVGAQVVSQVDKTVLEMELASACQRLEHALKENRQLRDQVKQLETQATEINRSPRQESRQDELMRMHTRAQLSLIEYLEGESDISGAMARFKRQLEREEEEKIGFFEFSSALHGNLFSSELRRCQ